MWCSLVVGARELWRYIRPTTMNCAKLFPPIFEVEAEARWRVCYAMGDRRMEMQ
jgi:hypothetical protein